MRVLCIQADDDHLLVKGLLYTVREEYPQACPLCDSGKYTLYLLNEFPSFRAQACCLTCDARLGIRPFPVFRSTRFVPYPDPKVRDELEKILKLPQLAGSS